MKMRRFSIATVLAAILIASASAATILAVTGLPYGILDYEKVGLMYTWPPPTPPGPFRLSIDADPTNGSGPCAPVDSARRVGIGETYQVAICLENPPQAPSHFLARILYDATLNIAPECADNPANPLPGEIVCPEPNDTQPALDDNPDANAGTTNWPNAAGQILGINWDCSYFGLLFPQGNDTNTPSKTDAVIECLNPTGNQIMPPYPTPTPVPPTSELSSTGALALITLRSTNTGTETLTFDPDTVVSGPDFQTGQHLGSCGGIPDITIPCLGATIWKTPCDCLIKDDGRGTSLCIAGSNWFFAWPGGSASGTSGVMGVGTWKMLMGRAGRFSVFARATCPLGPGTATGLDGSSVPVRILRILDTTGAD